MITNALFTKKHWKPPPYAILLTLLLAHTSKAQILFAEDNSENPEDPIDIIVDATPYRLTFSVEDWETYEIQNVKCKTIKTVKLMDNNEHVCENLEPCSSYLATLSIKKLKDKTQQIIEKTIETMTEYIEPQVGSLQLKAYPEEMYLTWQSTDRTCISTFVVEVKSVDKEFKWNVMNDKNEQIVDNLNPCQEQSIQLKTYDVNEILISNLTSTATTQYAEPGNITVTFEETTDGQVKVLWEPVQFKTCINDYLLNWWLKDCIRNNKLSHNKRTSMLGNFGGYITEEQVSVQEGDDNCEWMVKLTDPNAKDYIITGLQGCEEYEFVAYINNVIKSETEFFNSSEQVPTAVTLQTPEINPTFVTLHWDAPQVHKKCLSYYQINITGPLQRNEVLQQQLDTVTEDTEVLFEGLDPCGQYNYTITAISLNNTGISVSSSFVTTEAKPTPVRNYVVIPEPHALNISWDPPSFADLCLNGYRFSGWKDENVSDPVFDKVTNATEIRFDELYSCQSYTVQVIPTTTHMDGALIHIESETAASTSQAPNNFQAIGLYPNSLELSAQDSDLNNKCEIIFARFVCELSKNVDVQYKSAEQYVEGQMGGISFKSILSPLSPYTEYKCNVALYNVAGWSPNRTLIKKTDPYYPDPPALVTLKMSSSTTLNFIWKVPKNENGNIKLYISHFQRVEAAYYIPPHCTPTKSEPIRRETSSMEQSFTDLQSYTQYSIQVAAQNEYGIGEYTDPFMVKTLPSVSDPVTNLKVRTGGPYASDTEYMAYATVSFLGPCKANGEIEAFELEFTGERANYEPQYFQRTVLPYFSSYGSIVYNETDLRPEYYYSVDVVIRTKGAIDPSTPVHTEFDAPAGIPAKLDQAIVKRARVNAYEATNPTSSAVVQFPSSALISDSGSIIYVALLLSEKGCGPSPQLEYDALNSNIDWPDSRSWNEVSEDKSTGCIEQYQTTPLRWRPSSIINTDRDALHTNERDNDMIEYIIGIEKCQDTSKRYCNGPLKADTEYNLVIRLFTKSGYNDGALLAFKTDSLIRVTLILVSVTSCLLLALIGGFVYLWVTKKILWHSDAYHGIEDSFGDIIAKNFATFYREISRPDKIAREFKELTMVAMDLSYSASELGCNKNRYADIYPYDKNRVILDIDADGSDYINASFIDGYKRKKEYIATQGPKPESVMDFWRMVLQHNVRVIVMVTQFREGEVVKCHEYFPFKSKGINVIIKKKDMFEIYDRTEMIVSHDNYGLKQKVVHFYFKKWPDHGCPTEPMSLITFVRKVKAERIPTYSPIVVHCSAGVGRTGTFIGLDIIVQRLRNESKINIYETVKKLRFQRMKMVQTLTQYIFLYTCAYELVKHKSTRVPQTKTGKKVSFEDETDFDLPTPSSKYYARRTASDLSSIDENEYSERNSAIAITSINGDVFSIRENGMSAGGEKSNDLFSLDVHTSNPKKLMRSNSESGM